MSLENISADSLCSLKNEKEIVELLTNRVTNSLKDNVESKHRIKELEDENFDQMKAFAMSVIEVVDITDKVISHFGERMEGADKISLSIFKKYKVIQKDSYQHCANMVLRK